MAEPSEPTDAELDEFIRFTLAMYGIDISVLPALDDDALVDQASVLEACRNRIRQNLEVLEFELDPQYHLASYYASPQMQWTTPIPRRYLLP
jgi:hypothetical protein